MVALSLPKREILAQALDRSGLNRVAMRAVGWCGLLVLNYHRIGRPDESGFDPGLWSATEEGFDEQVRFLTRHFDVVGLGDLEEVLKARTGRHVLITFDDGYRDNYLAAFPILKTHEATATFFLATGFLDEPRVAWWDEISWMVHGAKTSRIAANVWTIQPVELGESQRSAALRRLLNTYKMLRGDETESYLEFLAEALGTGRCPTHLAAETWLTWDMVREMKAAGMSLGGHTANHPVLASLEAYEQEREIARCTARLRTELGQAPQAFSYPVGGRRAFNHLTRDCLERQGYRWSFSYYGGYVRPGLLDRFDVPRVAVEMDLSGAAFRGLVSLPQIFA